MAEIIALPPTKEVLQKPIGTAFSKSILNLWAESNDHTVFQYLETDKKVPQERVGKNIHNGVTTITLPENPTYQDILYASQQVNEKKSERNTPMNLFRKRLKDAAILLSQNKAFAGKEHDETIDFLFHLGYNLEPKSSTTPIEIKRADIQKQAITPPPDADPKKYEDGLYLFLLGKNTVLQGQPSDTKVNSSPEHTFYSEIYARWRKRRGIRHMSDNEGVRNTFDQWLLRKKEILSSLLSGYTNQSIGEGRGKVALDELMNQTVNQELESAVAEKGRNLIRDELQNPPHFEDIDPELQLKLMSLFGSVDVFKASNLSQTAKDTLALLEKEKGESLQTVDKVKALWELVQAYSFKETFKPSDIVTNKEFECNLRSLILGELLKNNIGSEVVVFGDMEVGHARLIVAEKNSLNTDKPLLYYVDPTTETNYVYDDALKKTKRVDGRPIRVISNTQTVQEIISAYQTNPDDIHINIGVDGKENIWVNQSIGSFPTMIEAVIWNNIASQVKTPKERCALYKKALHMAPQCGSLWQNLASDTSNVQEKIMYCNKAVELDPFLYESYIMVAQNTPDPVEKNKYYTLAFQTSFRFSDNVKVVQNWLHMIQNITDIQEKMDIYNYAERLSKGNPDLLARIYTNEGILIPSFVGKYYCYEEALKLDPNNPYLTFLSGVTGPEKDEITQIRKSAQLIKVPVGIGLLFGWIQNPGIEPDNQESARKVVMMLKEILLIRQENATVSVPLEHIEFAQQEIKRLKDTFHLNGLMR